MSEDRPIDEPGGGDLHTVRPDGFKISINRERTIGVIFEAEGSHVVTVVLPPDLADAVSQAISSEAREHWWKMIEDKMDQGLN